MADDKLHVPRFCLIGAGRFGRAHLRELQRLQSDGELELSGIVVRTSESQQRLAKEIDVPVHTALTAELLDRVDAVDIVTPANTHTELVRQTLPKCHVLLEKPMTDDMEEAQWIVDELDSNGHHLMIGHNYRFNPAVEKVKALVDAHAGTPRLVEITMLNEADPGVQNLNPNLEFIHAFDIMDFLFSETPTVETGKRIGLAHEISVRYGESLHCVMNIGWHAAARARHLTLRYPDLIIVCDLIRNIITVRRGHLMEKFNLAAQPVSLRRQLQRFVAVIRGDAPNPMPPELARRILAVAHRTQPKASKRRPRVAVIGGGVFGTNCALEFDDFCEVTLFERNSEFMQEVSFVNQWRHHSGFHYPRSYDTIQEIRVARPTFEALYGDAVLRNFPAYFCPSASGIEIPAERYIAACTSNYLSFRFEYPPADIVDRNTISLSLRSDEGVYDFERLRDLIERRLAQAANVNVELQSEVIDGKLLADGTKKLTIRRSNGTYEREFDYLINATYSNLNLLAKWFSLPVEPLRFDLYEMLLLRLDIDPVCVTILDGPFTSLVGTGKDNLFLLSHIHDSVLRSDITEDGLPPRWGDSQSNRDNMLRSASRYLPVLEAAEVVESRYATRAVNAFARDFDARPTVVRNHGFGSWSVLGGKIITCVTNAREIATAIAKAEGIDASRPQH